MKKSIIKTFIMIGMLFIGIGSVHAADGFTFKIDGAKDIKPGDVFSVNISVSGANETDTLYGYNLSVTDSASKLELVEGSSNIVFSTGDPAQAISSDRVIATLKYKANASGETTLKLTGTNILKNGEVDDTKNAKFNSGTVSIRDFESDSTLKSLKIPNTVLSPSFEKNIHDYKATVTDVTSIDIKAEPTSAHSTVSVTPNAGALVKGENDVTVVCRAENGSETTYSIKVILNVTPTEEELKAADTTLKSLIIKGQKIEFSPTEKKYYINVDYDVTKLNITATPTNPSATVDITGNTKFVVGKNTVKLLVTSEDKNHTDTYQILVTRANEQKKIVKTCPDTTSKREWILFTVASLVLFTSGIVLGFFLNIVLRKIMNKNKKVEEAVEIETLSDTIDLSDTVKKTKETNNKK